MYESTHHGHMMSSMHGFLSAPHSKHLGTVSTRTSESVQMDSGLWDSVTKAASEVITWHTWTSSENNLCKNFCLHPDHAC